MKIMVKYFLIIILFFEIIGCEKKNENNNKVKNIDNKEFEKILVNLGGKKEYIKFKFKALEAERQIRKFRKIDFNFEFDLGGINNENLLYPSYVRIDAKRNIYILDSKASSVRKYDKHGTFLKSYGNKGKGPGEFNVGFYFDVNDDGICAIINPNDNKFAVYKDKEIWEFKCKLMPGRLCFLNSDELVIFQFHDPIYTSPFRRINYKTEEIINYQNFISKDSFAGENYGMLPFLIGDIHQFKSEQMVYISRVMGYVILYSKDGKISDVFRLIDKMADQSIERKNEELGNLTMVRFPKADEKIFSSTNVYGDRLYVLSNVANTSKNQYIVDIYSLLKKKYLFSVKLNNLDFIETLYFTNKRLYAVKENTEVEVYSYKISGD